MDNARRRLRHSILGMTVEWEETPFEWVRPHRFGVVRRYARGPLAEMRVLAELTPLEGDRTRLSYRVAARPATAIGRLAIPVQIGLVSRWRFGRTFRSYARRVSSGEGWAPDPTPVPPDVRDRRRLAAVAGGLRAAGVEDEAARALARQLETADPLSLSRMRPYVLADVWRQPRRAVLDAFLHATRLGFLDLRWDVLCPLCRGVEERAETLSALRLRGIHCRTCGIDFSGEFQRSVELRFRPNPALRPIEEVRFCVAGPQLTPHVVAQQLLPPGERRTLRPAMEPGRHRIREHGGLDGPSFRVVERTDESPDSPSGPVAREGPAVEAILEPGGWTDVTGDIPPDGTVVVENRTPTERLVVLERTPWRDDAVTAAEVTRLPSFRDLFSGEVLRAGDFIEVGTLAVLFTDLAGSTALYRRMGDAPAFGVVMDHFEALDRVVRARNGTRIKTIGDAVMAVFPTPESAVTEALDAHQALAAAAPVESAPEATRPTRAIDHRRGSGLALKAGVHVGTCIAVTLNERLDYFGSTVNVAARLSSLAEAGDVVIGHAVHEDPSVAELLERQGVEAHASEVTLRGLEDEPMRVWRIEARRGAESAGAGPSAAPGGGRNG